MLVLTRRTDEGILIQDTILITVLGVDGNRVKLGIEAPEDVSIVRSELVEAIKEQNLAAARQKSESTQTALDTLRRYLEISKSN